MAHCQRAAWQTVACLAIFLAIAAGGARAGSYAVAGFEFSDELGGFKLLSVSGTGSRADPFVVVEEVYGTGPAVLVVRLIGWLRSERRYNGELGIRLRKVVINKSGFPWGVYRLELREQEDLHSDFHDGLSFDQTNRMPRPFKSDVFRHADENLEPVDSVTFSAGLVAAGDTVTMEVSITDPTPILEFYLRQSMNRPIAMLTPPS